VCALNTLQSNAATIARSVADRERRQLSIPETIQHAKRAGVSVSAYALYFASDSSINNGFYKAHSFILRHCAPGLYG